MAKDDKATEGQVKQTIVLKKKKVHKGSVKYEVENEGGLAVDNLYVYKDANIFKPFGKTEGVDDYPDEVTITIRAGGRNKGE